LLSKDVDQGLAILVDCLKAPAFEKERVDLARDQLLQEIKERNDDSETIEGYEWSYLVRGEGHWTNRHPTKASVESITRDDLVAFHKKYVGPKNFIVAVSGDFDRKDMKAKLDKAFANWPVSGTNPGPPPAPVAAADPGMYLVEKDVNQGRVTIGLRAPDRYDPDWDAFQVMNLVLGGAGFSSRLVGKIRSDEGLAYSVRSQFEGGHYYADAWRIRFQSKVRSVPYATDLAMKEVGQIASTEVSEAELSLAKNLIVEGMPALFESADAIAGVLAVVELTGRYAKKPTYFKDLPGNIGKVSAADVKRVAQRLLDPSKMITLCVGDTEEMLKGDPKHPSDLRALAGGEPKHLSLRDPLTMQPMPTP
jgi:predicted Zn-dependent peptidase